MFAQGGGAAGKKRKAGDEVGLCRALACVSHYRLVRAQRGRKPRQDDSECKRCGGHRHYASKCWLFTSGKLKRSQYLFRNEEVDAALMMKLGITKADIATARGNQLLPPRHTALDVHAVPHDTNTAVSDVTDSNGPLDSLLERLGREADAPVLLTALYTQDAPHIKILASMAYAVALGQLRAKTPDKASQ